MRSLIAFSLAIVCCGAEPFAIHRHPSRLVIEKDRYGNPEPQLATEVEVFWTPDALHFHFSCPYDTLTFKPGERSRGETPGLWDYDVVEVFIGEGSTSSGVYKEFEVSPRGEWIDLAVDRSRTGREVDAAWDSGFTNKTSIDEKARVWRSEIRIPWKSISSKPAAPGLEMRMNLYRIHGAGTQRKYLSWQPVNNPSFHTPAAFGNFVLR